MIAVVAVAALRPLASRRPAWAHAAVAVVAVLVVGWNLTTEIYAASGERDFSNRTSRASFGTTPRRQSASVAASSIFSQVENRFSSDQIFDISGRE